VSGHHEPTLGNGPGSADRSKVPHTLLLADDSVTIQRVIELTFADEDIQVVAVSDGNQAIARVEEQPPDIVLADIGMPGKSGYEVSSYIKHQPRLAHIPVLLLTGAFEPIDQQKAAEAGCDGVLAKPFEPQLVIGRVKELLSRPRPAPAPSSTAAAPRSVPPGSGSTPAAPPGAPGVGGDPSAGLLSPGDYFDELDAAFAKLPEARTAPQPALDGEHGITRQLDQAGSRQEGGADDRWDITFRSPPAEGLPAPASLAVPALSQTSASEPTAAPKPALPALTVAFAALLAVEQNPAAPRDPANWVPPLAITDEIIDRVTRRVLEQLSDRVVRETVSDIVSTVAERLVREEIERIKASIK
jgi:CheY-like chemotaxis protein